MNELLDRRRANARLAALFSLLALIALCVCWELFLAPIRPGGSWLVLKVFPLLLVLPGLLKQRVRTYQVVSLLVWIYFAEGATRVSSDPDSLSRLLAGVEVALASSLFAAVAIYAKTFKVAKSATPASMQGER